MEENNGGNERVEKRQETGEGRKGLPYSGRYGVRMEEEKRKAFSERSRKWELREERKKRLKERKK